MGDEGAGGHGDAERAAQDAAEIVRLAFAQAERITRQAEEERAEAARLLEEARGEAAVVVAGAKVERENLVADARRDRIAAEEALFSARREAEQEAEAVLARAGELARREAEILLEGSRMELLRARDEASTIRANAERDAEALLAAASQRARSTSAALLDATRRRLGESMGRRPPDSEPEERKVVDVTDDRPPPAPDDASLRPSPAVLAARRYRGDWSREPRDADVDLLVHDAVAHAVRAAFRRRRRRSQVTGR